MRTNNFLALLAILGLMIFTSCDKHENLILEEESAQVNTQRNYVPNQVIIKLNDGTSNSKISESVLSLIKGEVAEVISNKAIEKESSTKSSSSKKNEILVLNTKYSTMEAIEILKSRPEVEYAEPNWIYQHFATSNDTYYTNGSLWGMYGDATSPSNVYGSQAGEAWAAGKTGSTTVYIGIIDEGYMYTHEDLAANAGTNPGEIAGNGVDDDGNGFIDDWKGYDFVDGESEDA